MLQVIAQNKAGQRISFSGNAHYTLINVTGITPPTASVNAANLATKDGSVFNSSRLNNRNIVMTVLPEGSVESSRMGLYQVFKSKQYVKLFLYTSARSVYAEGYVESVNGDLYSMKQRIQISILCPDPYFKALESTEVAFDQGHALVDNDSDDQVGFVTELSFTGAAENVTIGNATTSESFSVNMEFQNGDKLILNTRRGEKGVWLERSGERTSVINHMAVDSDWLNLLTGENDVTLAVQTGAANVSGKVVLQSIYEGV